MIVQAVKRISAIAPQGFEPDQNGDTANDFDCGNGVAECRPCRDLAKCIHEISDAGTIRNPGDVKEFSNTRYDKENWNNDPTDRINNIAHDASLMLSQADTGAGIRAS
jgi:hypothetical protein